MISRAACVPRVCLSCRLGLARRAAVTSAHPRLRRNDLARRWYASDPFAAQDKARVESLISGQGLEDPSREDPSTRSTQSTGQRQRNEGDGEVLRDAWEEVEAPQRQGPRNLEESPTEPDEQKINVQRDVSAGRHSSQNRSDSPRHPPRKQKRRAPFKHKLLHQHRLGVNALGRDVNTLIIKNPDMLKPKKEASRPSLEPDTSDEHAAASDLNWKSMLSHDRAEKDGEEARLNIEEMRSKTEPTITRDEFDKLEEALVYGFTKNQLSQYHSVAGSPGRKQANSEPSGYRWLEAKGFTKPVNKDKDKAMTTKHRLARLIIRESWDVQILEEMQNPDLFSVAVDKNIFKLIDRLSSGAAETLQAELLDESLGEYIKPKKIASGNFLDIYARRPIVPAILARIDEMERLTIRQTIDISGTNIPLSRRADVLEQVARLTKTIVEPISGDALNVLWIVPKDATREARPREFENPADIVLRLLRGRPSQNLRSEEQIVSRRFKSEDRARAAGTFVSYLRENRSMSWMDKLMGWSRFVVPLPKIDPSKSSKPRWLGLADEVQIPAPESDPAITEANATTNHLTATFGHILHQTPRHGTSKRLKTVSNRRILVPVLPHPAAFTDLGDGEDLTKRSAIILNFAPQPHEQSRKRSYPEVKLRMPIKPDDDFSNFSMPSDSSLTVVIPGIVKDVMMPDVSVDVRITQQHEIPLEIGEREQEDYLSTFFASSDFNLVDGRLKTPNGMQVVLPNRWLDKASNSASASPVSYYFAGLEIHQTVEQERDSHILRYSSIEAGQHGGTRQELVVEAKTTSQGPEVGNTQRTEFLKALRRIVDGQYFSWTEGSKNARAVPKNHPELNSSRLSEDDLQEEYEDAGEEESVIEELSLGPGEAIDVGEECEEALRSGSLLAENVEEMLRAQSEVVQGNDA